MDPVAAALLAGSAVSAIGAHSANAANAKMARDQMAFQERMSSTAYQRATEDMRKAGINPIMAYSQGGASSPGGASSSNMNALSDFSNSARAASLESQAIKSGIAKNESEVALNNANAALSMNSARRVAAGLPEVETKALPWKFADNVVGRVFHGGVSSAKDSAARTAASLPKLSSKRR